MLEASLYLASIAASDIEELQYKAIIFTNCLKSKGKAARPWCQFGGSAV